LRIVVLHVSGAKASGAKASGTKASGAKASGAKAGSMVVYASWRTGWLSQRKFRLDRC
jgi:hypothetical protein